MANYDAVGALAGPVGMTVLGGAMQRRDAAAQARATAEARNNILTQYLQKQADFAKESRGYLDTRMGDYAPGAQDAALSNAQTARTATSTGAITGPSDGSEIAFSSSAPAVVRGEYAKRMLSAFNSATERAKASGKLGGYGDTWLGNNVGIADTGRRIDTVNNFSRGETGILNDQMDLAEIGAKKEASIWGPILSGAGKIGTSLASKYATGGVS
jgi:hypothetical protein